MKISDSRRSSVKESPVSQIEAQRSGFDLERRNDGAQPKKRREPQAFGVSEPCGVYSDDGTPGGTRTPDLLLRRQLLYPTELLAHMERVMGIEPTPTAWKAVVLAVILHPQLP